MIIGYAGQGAVQYAPLSPTNHMANWAHQHHHQQHHHHNKHHHHQHHRQLHHHHHQHHCHQYYRHQTVKKGVKKSWVIWSITFFNNEKWDKERLIFLKVLNVSQRVGGSGLCPNFFLTPSFTSATWSWPIPGKDVEYAGFHNPWCAYGGVGMKVVNSWMASSMPHRSTPRAIIDNETLIIPLKRFVITICTPLNMRWDRWVVRTSVRQITDFQWKTIVEYGVDFEYSRPMKKQIHQKKLNFVFLLLSRSKSMKSDTTQRCIYTMFTVPSVKCFDKDSPPFW